VHGSVCEPMWSDVVVSHTRVVGQGGCGARADGGYGWLGFRVRVRIRV